MDTSFPLRRAWLLPQEYLCETDNDVVVWADAICINQNNVEERNPQVRMMGNIYGMGKQEFNWTQCEIERVNT
jgi:hypothetical protein